MDSPADDQRSARGIDEVPVSLAIKDGKLTVESRSGAKSGSIELSVGETHADLTLYGPGVDQATATLTGPELSNFRTIVDAGLSSMTLDEAEMDDDARVLSTGYESLARLEDGFGATLDTAALQRLGLVDADGALAGGGRQVRCTILNSGTAILNLRGGAESPFEF